MVKKATALQIYCKTPFSSAGTSKQNQKEGNKSEFFPVSRFQIMQK